MLDSRLPFRRRCMVARRHALLSMEALEVRDLLAVAIVAAPLSAVSVSATFSVVNDWGTGFTGSMAVANNSSNAINGWTLEFDFAANLTQIWNAKIVSHVGDHYVLQDAGYNATIAPGQTTTFGFNGAPGHITAAPTHYVLNGTQLGGGGPAPVQSAPTVAVPAAAATSSVIGKTVALTVLGADDGGEPSLTYRWTTVGTPPAPVSLSANNANAAKNTVATFSKAGAYAFQVTITDAAGLSVTSNVNLTVAQTLTAVVVSPATATVAATATQSFTAQALDQFANPLATQPTFTWSLASGAGTISGSGLYTAPAAAASATVRAVAAGVGGTSSITINSPATPGTASAVYSVASDWGSGFTGNLALTNTGSTSINGWTLEFDFPATITQIWNAKIVSHVGNHYVLQDLGYNATIAPGQATSFGFNGQPGGNAGTPTHYVLNGVALSGGATVLPALSTSDLTVSVGSTATQALFTVTLTQPATTPISVAYTTADGTAKSATDYQAVSGTLQFRAGQTTQTIAVPIYAIITANKPDITFSLVLSNPNGATLARTIAVGTIHDVSTAPATPPTIRIGNVTVTEPSGQATSGFFQTAGNQIVNSQGTSVKIAGINWFGFETGNYVPHGLWARNYQDMMNQMKQLGFNTIRMPFSNAIFNPANVPNSINFSLNPDFQGLSSLQILDKIVSYAGQLGLRIILDHHSALPDNHANEPLWYIPGDANNSEQVWINNWVALAQRYAGNPTVIGADLQNEPHGQASWGDGNLATDWRLAAQRAGNAVLAANPNWLIFVEGVESYNGQSTWWGGNLMGAGPHPVVLNVPNRVVYSPHDYPASVYNQSWFNAANYPNNLTSVWNQYWGYLYQDNIAPVWLGEFGSKLQTTSDQQWYQQITSYLGNTTSSPSVAGQRGMSWTWWSWNPNSTDTGGILQDDWKTASQSKVQGLIPLEFAFPTTSGPVTVTATFVVTLSAPSTQTVTVAYSTANGTASSGTDYVATNGTLTFAPGQTQATVSVTILYDPTLTHDATFFVLLTNPTHSTLDGTGQGTGIIHAGA
ncbi:Aryl-phospho-beta-D-glucosidase BglC, GH1 family [Singulisphaera sp. GP187]|uniref:cellulase family glycosylhydrolase n=1 Tax=Singulisphaera sp. GP187 TaxID=1882752 RepID=UPI00092C9050|nr:cellulase family glycosylhydrolase [Singulisphaera sp. GP187]SIO34822.1 Aryl-phospho-beta-D-glucosidase BglC, GH1 family [Singulisphaera sp. GP187]